MSLNSFPATVRLIVVSFGEEEEPATEGAGPTSPPAAQPVSCFGILKQEGIKFSPDVVAHVIKSTFPDMRKALNELQKLSQQDNLNDLDSVKTIITDTVSFFQILKYLFSLRINFNL